MASETLFSYGQPTGDGILPSQEILELVKTGKISAARDFTEDQVQPSSVDLRLGGEAYRIRASFLPGNSTTLLNKARANRMLVDTIEITDGALLEPEAIYVIPLMETLSLPPDLYGIANPKSSTGRLDIFTRLITECGDEFERVPKGYRGRLYIEVVSQTFPIIVRSGMRLNQLRFGRGRRAVVGEDRLREFAQQDYLIYPDEEGGQARIDRGLRLTVDLQGNGDGIVGYRARKTKQPIDLSLIGHYEVSEFWDPIYKDEECILSPREFYILASKQRVRIPPDLAAEMLPYDLSTQEFRVHYAGFFDPGFGYGENGEISGTRAVLEVRANEMPILLEDDQFVGRLTYYKMSQKPDKIYGGTIGSNYQQQGLALSKQFKRKTHNSSSNAEPGITQQRTSNGSSLKNNPVQQVIDLDDEGHRDTPQGRSLTESNIEAAIRAKGR